MMSSISFDSELLRPNQIGTFLRNTAVDAQLFGYGENVKTVSENLRKLFTLNNVEISLMMYSFVINDFLNLELNEDFEVDNEFFDLKQFKKCYEGLIGHIPHATENDRDAFYRQRTVLYTKPSPCLNISKYPECHGYCQWHKKILEIKTTEEINDIIR